jgi:hypothetical protein
MVCQKRTEQLSQRKNVDGSWGPCKLYSFEFSAVYGDDTPENKLFWESTPSGKLELSVVKMDVFEVGKAYYLDLEVAP